MERARQRGERRKEGKERNRVEVLQVGIEPTAHGLKVRCATNCATGAYGGIDPPSVVYCDPPPEGVAGLRPLVTVGLALDLHDFVSPQVRQGVLHLGAGHAHRQAILDALEDFRASRGFISQRADHDVMDGIVDLVGLRLGGRALVQFLVQFIHDLGIVEAKVGQSVDDGGQSGFLHDDSLSGFLVFSFTFLLYYIMNFGKVKF